MLLYARAGDDNRRPGRWLLRFTARRGGRNFFSAAARDVQRRPTLSPTACLFAESPEVSAKRQAGVAAITGNPLRFSHSCVTIPSREAGEPREPLAAVPIARIV